MGSTFLSPPLKRSNSTLYASMPDPTPYPANGSSKRSKNAPPPLSVPPGHAAFRLLCHASRIGGVIGKSGHVIKTLQQATGAKIRVEDAPNESPDRVILVIAPSASTAKLVLKSNTNSILLREEGEEEFTVEVSKAQEALVKVFERILEVAAENDGGEVGVGMVSCRLLAEVAQVGSVIGKGGKVVEKIRKESGCKVRVLSDKLPTCAQPTDEIVEIEGDVLAVKKALIAVSRRLQDCSSVEKTRIIASKPVEALPHETFSDLHLDLVTQRNSGLHAMPSSSINYASGVHAVSLDVDRVPALETKTLGQEVIFKILCSNDRVGGVIGKGGAIVRALQNDTGAGISVGASIANCDERVITISASENPDSRYSPTQKAVVLVFSRSIEAGIEKGQDSGSNKGSPVNARLVVSSNQVGCLLGKGGAIVSEMRKVTGAGIRIIGGEQVPKCVSENDQVVQISGEFSNVQDALYNVTGRLRDNLFSSTQNNLGTRSSSSVFTDTSPYGRLRDPPPLGSHPSVGVSHSLGRHTTLTQSTDPSVAVSHSLSRHTINQSLDNLGISHGFDAHTRAVSCVKFSNDGTLLASGSLDKTLIVWSAQTLSLVHRLVGHSEGVSDLAWSSDSHYICSASDDRTLRIWDARAATSESAHVKTLRGHSDLVFCVNFSPQSNLIVSGSFDETIRIWEVKTGKCLHAIRAHSMPVTSVSFNRDGSLIVSASHDGTCKIWDSSKATLLKALIDDKVPAVSFAKFSPNGKFILVATLNDSLKLWNYSVGKFLKIYAGHENRVYCISSTFSVTNGKYIVSGSEDRCIYLWDLQQKTMVQKIEGHTDTVISVTCHPTENKIASAGLDADRSVRIWVQDS